MKILVGNLSSDVSPDFLQRIFQVYGSIESVSLTVDISTNETIGEVEMPDSSEASNAVTSIDGNRIEGQALTIKNKVDFMNADNALQKSEDGTDSEFPPEKRKSSERRIIDSPLFKAEKGIVIDRRDYTDRRDNPNIQADNDPPLKKN